MTMSNTITPLDVTIQQMMIEYGEFRDYDDANMIAYYRSLGESEQRAVDNLFTYFCGTTFNQIILSYERINRETE